MVDTDKQAQITIRTRSLLTDARVNRVHVPQLRVKFPGSNDLEGVLEIEDPNPDVKVEAPTISIFGSYLIGKAWLSSLIEIAEGRYPKGASPSLAFGYYPVALQGFLVRVASEHRLAFNGN